jgi:homoserine dehydrogenase
MYLFWFALQLSTDSFGLPKPPNMDHLFSKPMVKKPLVPQKKPAASPTTIAKATKFDATADAKDDFVVEQSTLAVTKATAQSYIQCFKKKRLVVSVTKKSVPNHKVFIEKLLKFCKTPGVTKSQVVQHRNKLLA